MNRRRHLLIVVPYVLIVLTASFSSWQLHQRQVDACHERREDRTVLRALVVQAYSGTVNPLDLTKVAGFGDLDDATQQYLSNLSAAINAGGTGGRDQAKQQALDTIPPITC
jgi:hypothetical protein